MHGLKSSGSIRLKRASSLTVQPTQVREMHVRFTCINEFILYVGILSRITMVWISKILLCMTRYEKT